MNKIGCLLFVGLISCASIAAEDTEISRAKEFALGMRSIDPVADCLVVEPVMDKPLVFADNRNRDMATVAYLMRMKIDQDRYFANVAPKLQKFIAKVAIRPPEIHKMQATPARQFVLKDCVRNGKSVNDLQSCKMQYQLQTGSLGQLYGFRSLNSSSTPASTGRVALVVKRNKLGTQFTVEVYEIPPKCYDFLREWEKVCYGKMPVPLVTLVLKDADGEELYADSFKPASHNSREPLACCQACTAKELDGQMYLFAPWLLANEPLQAEYFWLTPSVPKVVPELLRSTEFGLQMRKL